MDTFLIDFFELNSFKLEFKLELKLELMTLREMTVLLKSVHCTIESDLETVRNHVWIKKN